MSIIDSNHLFEEYSYEIINKRKEAEERERKIEEYNKQLLIKRQGDLIDTVKTKIKDLINNKLLINKYFNEIDTTKKLFNIDISPNHSKNIQKIFDKFDESVRKSNSIISPLITFRESFVIYLFSENNEKPFYKNGSKEQDKVFSLKNSILKNFEEIFSFGDSILILNLILKNNFFHHLSDKNKSLFISISSDMVKDTIYIQYPEYSNLFPNKLNENKNFQNNKVEKEKEKWRRIFKEQP